MIPSCLICIYDGVIYFVLISSNEITLEPYETAVTKESTPWTLSLAEHLHSIGAKMYGAFWCSHCLDQKEVSSPPMVPRYASEYYHSSS